MCNTKLGYALAAALQGPLVPTPIYKRARSAKLKRCRASAKPLFHSPGRAAAHAVYNEKLWMLDLLKAVTYPPS